jgi:hypothetical protein
MFGVDEILAESQRILARSKRILRGSLAILIFNLILSGFWMWRNFHLPHCR